MIQQTAAFENEFSEEYSRLLLQLKRQLESTDDPAREEKYKAAFVATVVALMIRLLRKYGRAAARAGWRDEDDPLWAGIPLADRGALLQELDSSWQAAALEGLMPRLQRAATYQGEGEVISRLMGVGAYGLLFAGMVWMAFWGARTRSGSADVFYLWSGTLDDVICVDCEGRVGKIYRASNLPGLPGDRSTICNGNCRCWLEEINPDEAGIEETF